MTDRRNYLLGRGEVLTSAVEVHRGGIDKDPPYEFEAARLRLGAQIREACDTIDTLPADACPGGETVIAVTLHPRYIAKSYFPGHLLRVVGLREVGSKVVSIVPRAWSKTKHPERSSTTQLWVAGHRDAFGVLYDQMNAWEPTSSLAEELLRIEDLHPVDIAQKLQLGGLPMPDEGKYEVVLHTGGHEQLIGRAFELFGARRNVEVDLRRARIVGGLYFVPVIAPSSALRSLAAFSFLRLLRCMPRLRASKPVSEGRTTAFRARMPDGGPLDGTFRVAVFDGGIPDGVDLGRWGVQVFDAPGVGEPDPDCQEHGLMVTSALLHGSITEGETAEVPISGVDHYRVVGTSDLRENSDYYDVLDRIELLAQETMGKYQFINISIGPEDPATDDYVNLWTSTLDNLFATPQVLATVAVGNNGCGDAASGNNRVQAPGDGVNVLSVGASDSDGRRADYSAVGPGRQAAAVKPDVLTFGGTVTSPFYCLANKYYGVRGDQGTSFAAPLVLRSASALRACLGSDLTPLAIRSLLIHRAVDEHDQPQEEVGWGILPQDPLEVILCKEGEVLVVYQGLLAVNKYLRAPVPLPKGALKGRVAMAATMCIASKVSPEHPGTYTKAGLSIFFRPDKDKVESRKEGDERPPPKEAKTRSFFPEAGAYDDETALRSAGKWETCRHATGSMNAGTLNGPAFDIYYNHRDGARPMNDPPEMPYALVVSVKAPKVPDLYDKVLRAYQGILVPLQSRIEQILRVRR